jgi:hypothetical protein
MQRSETPFTVTSIGSGLDYWAEEEYWEEEENIVPPDTHCVYWKCGLLALPDCALSLNSLTVLDCRYNKIKSLPEDLSCIAQVQHLDLTGNALGGLPSALGALSCLRGLFLAHNSILALPDTIGDLACLEAARLDHNLIAELPYQAHTTANQRLPPTLTPSARSPP